MSNNKLKVSDTDGISGLYTALHDFNCNQQHVLCFRKGQVVEVTKSSSSSNWLRGRIDGKAGFLPANGYLKQIDLSKCRKVIVRQDFNPVTSGQLRIVEGQVLLVIAKLSTEWWIVRSDTGKWGQVPAKYLKEAGNGEVGYVTVHSHSNSPDIVVSKPAAGLSRTQSYSSAATTATASTEPDMAIPRSSTVHHRLPKASHGRKESGSSKTDAVAVTSGLVECVRKHGIKYQTSKDIVRSILGKLSEEYSSWSKELSLLTAALTIESDMLHNSVDSLKLEQLYEQVLAFTEDEQQRGWICKDDTEEIAAVLADIVGLLRTSNPNVVKNVLQNLKYEPLLTLVHYYQLEKRSRLKQQVLEIFFENMSLEPVPVCSVLLTSRLPVQLVSDIQSNTSPSDVEWMSKVFSSCLSYPNVMPRNHHDHINEVFIKFLLNQIESPEYEPDSNIPVHYLRCLLALNLHYPDIRQNSVCELLKKRSSARVLTETVLVAFNRSDNLVGYFPNSLDGVYKLVLDMFSSGETADLFFTNDVGVVIDILHRSIADREEGDPERQKFIVLLDRVLSNTNYTEHGHLKYELHSLLTSVAEEEGEDTDTIFLAAEVLKKHKDKLS